MDFADELVYVRAKMKISQEQLAKELGVSVVTVNRWENNVTTPSKAMIARLTCYCESKGIILNKEAGING